MENEMNMKFNFCCICGNEFKKIDGYVSRIPGEIKGTYQCVPCSNDKERKELLSKKTPAYIYFTQKWENLPGRLRIEIPFKNKSYFESNATYHVMIWRDE